MNDTSSLDMVQSRCMAAVLLIARILMSPLFLVSGLGKIAHPVTTQAYIVAAHMPAPSIAYFGAIAVELLGGLALIAGFRPRITATILILYTLAATAFFHAKLGDPSQVIHVMKNLAIVGGLLQLWVWGPGRWVVGSGAAKRASG